MIGITMGDPNGVGPEIIVKASADGILPDNAVVYGNRRILRYVAGFVDGEIDFPIIDVGDFSVADLKPGQVDGKAGHAALSYVKAAAEAAVRGEISAMVTLPINKEAVRLTHPDFSGHTEYIAELCGNPPVTMMLATEKLVVTHVSTHVSIVEAAARVKKDRILEVIRLTDEALKKIRPTSRIAVAGLNPHAGENGAFGQEELLEIIPAIEQANKEGYTVIGPEPGDTVFFNAVHRDRFDAVVCMYHDQGHIFIKTLDFDGGVNVTLGLPIIRTSVDHGTAYDIAYTGIARVRSFALALKMAQSLAGEHSV
ncbi:MAG: 4-hydroxythreonine-4-phosphate dehydrogenase PdxA [Sphaerochaetaceae bacterium]|nr:4-hydroxythreonine-4-phosphate dehydrogenase PdxA [Sphaerochaetaceae bacterium]